MTDEEQDKSRFQRVRNVGDNIREAFDTVSGRSLSDDMDEFTDAYAEALQGVHADVEGLKRRIERLPKPKDEEARAEIRKLSDSLATLADAHEQAVQEVRTDVKGLEQRVESLSESERKSRLAMTVSGVSVAVALVAVIVAAVV